MIKKLLIANRGEIAVRIIRTCRELGIETVAVYSTADRESLHVKRADNAVCIGPPPATQSYLVRNNLLMAAVKTNCDAIHPGVGFLSENAAFARLVRDNGLIFIGPDPDVIDLLGDKVQARKTAQRFGLPVTPGTGEAVSDTEAAHQAARELGFPVIIKAASGGGGKGMRIVRSESALAENFALASAEAETNFADKRVYIERFLENPRHVELQLVADGNGAVAVLGERDCSVQKHHQKLIEESPSPGVTPAMRARMTEGAVTLFRELKYQGAGTIEFLVEGEDCYFMEVNARIQVEHPVSEFVTGADIIREQILACTEGRMELDPNAVRVNGWAVECRINALSPGRVTRLDVPGGLGVRFDSFLYNGYEVPPHYDSMVAKLIVHAPTRACALIRMERALGELCIEGIRTNRQEQQHIIEDHTFRSGDFGNAYYERKFGGAKNGV
ncbi:MAG: acetyl-CoA carboxylase biotin carboxylase subunit [Treponema sp.]|jgi:acetyl-CoA carboxylase biotin carboxylase subunit|nr:acetyl-CoA carboxylase biotin carboxylase subunit [Treponema sp.]